MARGVVYTDMSLTGRQQAGDGCRLPPLSTVEVARQRRAGRPPEAVHHAADTIRRWVAAPAA